MASVNDWAAKAARRILDDLPPLRPRGSTTTKSERYPTEERIAAIIATFAEPLTQLLQKAKREHYHCDDSWYCCKKCTHSDHSGLREFLNEEGSICDCGADAWNKKVDDVLNG